MLVDFTLSNAKLKATGWKPKRNSRVSEISYSTVKIGLDCVRMVGEQLSR
jgi:hypothetical protein